MDLTTVHATIYLFDSHWHIHHDNIDGGVENLILIVEGCQGLTEELEFFNDSLVD